MVSIKTEIFQGDRLNGSTRKLRYTPQSGFYKMRLFSDTKMYIFQQFKGGHKCMSQAFSL